MPVWHLVSGISRAPVLSPGAATSGVDWLRPRPARVSPRRRTDPPPPTTGLTAPPPPTVQPGRCRGPVSRASALSRHSWPTARVHYGVFCSPDWTSPRSSRTACRSPVIVVPTPGPWPRPASGGGLGRCRRLLGLRRRGRVAFDMPRLRGNIARSAIYVSPSPARTRLAASPARLGDYAHLPEDYRMLSRRHRRLAGQIPALR